MQPGGSTYFPTLWSPSRNFRAETTGVAATWVSRPAPGIFVFLLQSVPFALSQRPIVGGTCTDQLKTCVTLNARAVLKGSHLKTLYMTGFFLGLREMFTSGTLPLLKAWQLWPRVAFLSCT